MNRPTDWLYHEFRNETTSVVVYNDHWTISNAFCRSKQIKTPQEKKPLFKFPWVLFRMSELACSRWSSSIVVSSLNSRSPMFVKDAPVFFVTGPW